ncbi:chemotaxis protein CheB [Mucilaginibacter sp. L3T2-6]|uniref:chemotaxis protein CheB n=1 Tax=Mucilaginibacter sp. L3T2-6 TaxID=3062491 RepID=UPI0029495EA0|nr:chemotaxis protein CheB [Mucilaginibacter sp. L3T2-6]MDV6217620.1 chemotaxis protein CheB [Mucilaginibacter sp. L3T2-6]
MALDENIINRWHSSEILLIGGSAGSFKLMFKVVQFLPADLNKSVIIVMHRKRNFASEIERLFARNSMMKLREIGDKDIIDKNTIYVAPANYHVLIEGTGHFALDVSDPVWFSKPSIDITFESAAEVFKNKCTAILLSGANQDGAAGLLKLRDAGSLTIAQDPDDAELPEMPREAINMKAADYVLNTIEIIELLRS